jgi:hypothetical protein
MRYVHQIMSLGMHFSSDGSLIFFTFVDNPNRDDLAQCGCSFDINILSIDCSQTSELVCPRTKEPQNDSMMRTIVSKLPNHLDVSLLGCEIA